MDYETLFHRQGRAMDDLLMAAFPVEEERFTAPGPGGAPSLRDLFLAWLEEQRRLVAALTGTPWRPLPPEQCPTVQPIAQIFGGSRLSLREHLEGLGEEGMARAVSWADPDGTPREATVDEILVHLALHAAGMHALLRERLRRLGADLPPGPPLLP